MTLVPFAPPAPAAPARFNVMDLAEDYWRLAQKIAGTEFVPTALRKRPEAVLAALLSGAERGLGPMESLRSVHVIEGRPSLSAEVMRALVFAAGHNIEIVESTAARATVIGRRRDSETTSPPFTWTMDRARRAKLANKKNWQEYPEAMLLARATADLCRAVFPDVIGGLATVEEAADAGPEPRQRRRRVAASVPPPAAADPPPPQTPETPPESPQTAPEPDTATGVLAGIPGADRPSWAPEPTMGGHHGAAPGAQDNNQPADDNPPADAGQLRSLHAKITKAFPGSDKPTRDRYRHALVALATHRRDTGPIITSAGLDTEELLRLSRFLTDIKAGRSTVVDGPDGIEVRNQGGRPWTVTLNPLSVLGPDSDDDDD